MYDPMYDREYLAKSTCFVPHDPNAGLCTTAPEQTTVQSLVQSGTVQEVNGLEYVCDHMQTHTITSTLSGGAFCGQAGLGPDCRKRITVRIWIASLCTTHLRAQSSVASMATRDAQHSTSLPTPMRCKCFGRVV